MAKVRRKGGTPPRHHQGNPNRDTAPPGSGIIEKRKKPYGFAATPPELSSKEPIWHDGSSSRGKVSGELRCELKTLTPMLVGWERRQLDEQDGQDPWRLATKAVPQSAQLEQLLETAALQAHPDDDDLKPAAIAEARQKYKDKRRKCVVEVTLNGQSFTTIHSKALLYPLRMPAHGPVIIPGDSLKGLLRHELGALLGAPMERVAERSYSYRPNALFTKEPGARLVARLAMVLGESVEHRPLAPKSNTQARVPTKLRLFPLTIRYDQKQEKESDWYRFDSGGQALPYSGGLGAGDRLNAKKRLHRSISVSEPPDDEEVPVAEVAIQGYLRTLRHLLDTEEGHFSERHPDVPDVISSKQAKDRLLSAATAEVFQPGDAIWVEWDVEKGCIVSFGWHYYYRWSYQDSVRRRVGDGGERGDRDTHDDPSTRRELRPSKEELERLGDGSPKALTAVRRLLGYTGDNEGSKGIGADEDGGHGHHSQLMGRLSINSAIEVVENETERFLCPTFLAELGQPKPSAVEHYLKQPHVEKRETRPSDKAQLVTYGDADGYDSSGELAGRKIYLDRSDAYNSEPWRDHREMNRLNDRSTLALEASKPGRRFRFTVRFRDLEVPELAAVMLALCPDQFAKKVGGIYDKGYCSKLGYARPLGWGSVQTRVVELHLLEPRGGGVTGELPVLTRKEPPAAWFEAHRPMLDEKLTATWLDLHRRHHPDAGDYPRRNGKIFAYHTKLRGDHSRHRRYAAASKTGRK